MKITKNTKLSELVQKENQNELEHSYKGTDGDGDGFYPDAEYKKLGIIDSSGNFTGKAKERYDKLVSNGMSDDAAKKKLLEIYKVGNKASEEETKKKEKEKPQQQSKQTEGSKATTVLKGISDATRAASDIPIEKGKTVRGSYPDLTNEELNKRVARLQLEQRYSDLAGDTKYIKSGGEKTREMLQTVGAIAGVAVSIATIIAAFKSGKKKPSNN